MAAVGANSSGVQFHILGPLRIEVDGEPFPLSGTLPACVLGVLLLERGRVVPLHRLVTAVWDDDPPETGSHQVRKAVSVLRKRLPGGERLLLTESGGYRAVVNEEQVDAGLFTIRLRRAEEAEKAGLASNAAEELGAAGDLWRGRVLQGLGRSVLESVSLAWEEKRLAAAEHRARLLLELGQSAALVGEMRSLVEQAPLREALRGLLMLALYRSGRQAEALEEFAAIRDTLARDLGVYPGPELLALHEAVLRQSPELHVPARRHGTSDAPPSFVPPVQSPCTLPYDVADFTGREAELERLTFLSEQSRSGGTRIVLVDGMGGTGKTALAVHAAHLLLADYPDGQLYVDLHAYTPGEEPENPASVLAALLRTLGVESSRIPEDMPSRIALWRAVTARRRVLLLLDNAATAEQVRPLIPGSAHCLVLITSRTRLVELEGASWLPLDLLSAEDSVELVARSVDRERLAADPGAVDELVRLCGYLPLALRIASARLCQRPHWSVRKMADLLRDESRRMRELRSGELSVAAALTLSFRSMSEDTRTAFHLLAAHPGSSLAVDSAAALLGTGVDEAGEILEHLLDVQLLRQRDRDRYTFHDLVRSFARSLSGGGDGVPEETRQESAERLLRHLLWSSEHACGQLFPQRAAYPVPLPDPAGVHLHRFGDAAAAVRWFRAEHSVLGDALSLAERQGLHEYTVLLARNLVYYLHNQGYHEEYAQVCATAVEAARALDEPLLLGLSLTNLASACWQLDRFRTGRAALGEALELARRVADSRAEAAALSRMAVFQWSLGELPAAVASYQAAVALHRRHDSERETAETLTNLCDVSVLLSHPAQALEAGREAAAIARRIKDRALEAGALAELVPALLVSGEPHSASHHAEAALHLAEELEAPPNIVRALLARATVRLAEQDMAGARVDAERALNLTQLHNFRTREASALNLLGRVRLAGGEAAEALTSHASAWRIASPIGLRLEMAAALSGKAAACYALNDLARAADHAREASLLRARMGLLAPEPPEIVAC